MVIITRERTARADQELVRIDASIIEELLARLLPILSSAPPFPNSNNRTFVKPKKKNQQTDLLINCVRTSCIDYCILYGPISGCMNEMAEIWAMGAGHSGICKEHAVAVPDTRSLPTVNRSRVRIDRSLGFH